MRILLMSDNPGIHTGMARVHREIGLGLHKKGHNLISIGWFTSENIKNTVPWQVVSTKNQFYGADIFDSIVRQFKPEIVLTIGDIWMIKYIADPGMCRTRQFFRWIGYTPIDGESFGGGVPVSWPPIYENMDYIVAYTEYGKEAILKSMPERKDISIIPHGVDTNTYHPIPEAERLQLRRQFNIADDIIVYLMVARNQFRKNIPEFCKGWKKFISESAHSKARFWPHMCFNDPMGWKLDEVFNTIGVESSLVYFDEVAHKSSNVDLIPEKDLNALYNIADVFVLLAGEGWGLPTLEAMACGKPCIVLNHSASIELVKGHGELVNCSPYYMTGGHGTERPYPDLNDLVVKLDKLYHNVELRKKYGQQSLEFAKKLTWDNAVEEWEKLLRRVENPFLGELELTEVI